MLIFYVCLLCKKVSQRDILLKTPFIGYYFNNLLGLGLLQSASLDFDIIQMYSSR